MRDSAHNAQCVSNLRQTGSTILVYVTDNGTYPSGNSPMLVRELAPYLNPTKTTSADQQRGTALDVCPSRKIIKEPTVENPFNRSYGCNPFLLIDNVNNESIVRMDPSMVRRPSETIMYMDANQRPSNGNSHICMNYLSATLMPSQEIAKADDILEDGLDADVNGGTEVASYRFRHAGERANAVHADGSVSSYKKGTLRQRNFAVKY